MIGCQAGAAAPHTPGHTPQRSGCAQPPVPAPRLYPPFSSPLFPLTTKHHELSLDRWALAWWLQLRCGWRSRALPAPLEQAPALAHLLRELDLPQSWCWAIPTPPPQALAELYTRHIEAEPLVQLRRHVTLAQVEHLSATRKAFVLSDGTRLESRALVLATGLRTKRLAACTDAARAPLDAEQLTQQRNHLKGQRILLLGGGDNAVENALFLAQQGNEVVLWARNPLRAQRHFQAQLRPRTH